MRAIIGFASSRMLESEAIRQHAVKISGVTGAESLADPTRRATRTFEDIAQQLARARLVLADPRQRPEDRPSRAEPVPDGGRDHLA